MAVIITLDTLKNILKKFQGIIFNKYDNKIDTLDTDVNNRLGSLNSEIDTKLSNKVDKVSGKDLSTNDFTDEEKEKLASLSNYDDTELLEKINQIRPGYFTYIVKDNETLKNWAENVEGNDYSHILILGVELEYNGEVSNSSSQSIYALGGNKIRCNGFRDFKNVYGVNRVGNSITTSSGFIDCEYLTDCTFTNEWQREDGGFGIAFFSCDHLNNCTVYSNWVGYGFNICNYVNNCSYINHCEDACNFLDYGFVGCNYVRNCIYDVTQTNGVAFSGCYSDNKKTPCSNTVEGGFNFSNNDEGVASLKTDLTQEITDRQEADRTLQENIDNVNSSTFTSMTREYMGPIIETIYGYKNDTSDYGMFEFFMDFLRQKGAVLAVWSDSENPLVVGNEYNARNIDLSLYDYPEFNSFTKTSDILPFAQESFLCLDLTNNGLYICQTLEVDFSLRSFKVSELLFSVPKDLKEQLTNLSTRISDVENSANKVVVDTALSSTSTNPVQNKVVNTALGNKVDKVSGKGLSTNDYTTTEKNKLAGIATGANKITVDTALSSTSTNPVQNKVINSALSGYSKLQLTSLWSGSSSVNAQTLTLSQPYTNFKFIVVEGCAYNEPNSQRMYAYIPASQCGISVSEDGDEFLLCGSTADTNRRIRFGFPTTTTLYKTASDGTSSHLPVITNVWGIK